jgi:hypothetical protein
MLQVWVEGGGREGGRGAVREGEGRVEGGIEREREKCARRSVSSAIIAVEAPEFVY